MHATQEQLQDPALELRPVPEVPSWSLVAQDRALSQHIYQTVGQQIPRSLLMALEHSGNGLIWLALSLGTLLHPALSADQRCLAVNFLLAFFVDLAIVGTLKGLVSLLLCSNKLGRQICVPGHASNCHAVYINHMPLQVRRPRPIYNKSGDFLLVVSVDRFSFPSGHTSRQAACSWALSCWYVDRTCYLVSCAHPVPHAGGLCCRAAYVAAFICMCCAGVSPALCLIVSFWAAIVAVSRAALGRHYAGDVLAGLLVGIINMGFTTRGTYNPTGFWVDAEQFEHLTKLAINYGRQWLQH